MADDAARETPEPSSPAAGEPAPALAVDLDGTLLRSDLLAECFAAGLSARPGATLGALAALAGPGGRLAFKARLAEIATPDIATLPYEPEVIALVERARAEGRRTVLVSASDARLVQAVADHLGIFDDAVGSGGEENLKGERKAAYLVRRFGPQGFDYVADAQVDLPVWAEARRAVTVGASPALRAEVDALRPGTAHLAPPPQGLAAAKPYLRAIRPHQWLKNALVFLPALAAHVSDPAVWLVALLAAIAFSAAASAVYLVNDLLDLGPDRAHPRKRRRPFAQGSAKLAPGGLLAMGLAGLAAAIALALPAAFALTLAVYGALTFAYSMALKRLLMIDIVTLAGLYTLRVVAGGAAIGVVLSPWLIAFSGFLFLALAAVKRQAELVDAAQAGRERAAGRAWRASDAPITALLAVSAGHAAVVVLALYIAQPKVQALYSTPSALWLACPVLVYWLGRLVLLTHRGQMHDDPLAFAIRDRTSLACAALMGLGGLAGALL